MADMKLDQLGTQIDSHKKQINNLQEQISNNLSS
jgi:hypothetical protein